jgi:hypothetical protein
MEKGGGEVGAGESEREEDGKNADYIWDSLLLGGDEIDNSGM